MRYSTCNAIPQYPKSKKHPYETLENLEKKHIITVTRYTKGNISKAADILGVSRNTLYNKLKKYEIEI